MRRTTSRSAAGEWLLAAAMALLGAPLLPVLLVAGVALALVLHDWAFLLPVAAWSVAEWWRAGHSPVVGGRLLRPADEPELAALVDRVAERVGFTAALVVRTIPVPEAALASTRVGPHRGVVLALGWPLLRLLPQDELAAVIAHELAHHTHTRDRRTRWLLSGRAAVAERTDARLRPPAALTGPLLAASRPAAWSLELAADAAAARAVGTAPCARALTDADLVALGFEVFGEWWYDRLGQDGCYPADFLPALQEAMADPYVATRLAERQAALDAALAADPAASHPATATRVAALAEHDVWPVTGREPLRLRQADELDSWAAAQLTEEAPQLRPARVLATDPDRLAAPASEAREALLAAAGEILAPAASVAAALETVRDERRWRDVAAALDPDLRRAPASLRAVGEPDAFAGCVTAVVAGVLRDAGWPPASRWLTGVRTAPDGSTVDIRAVVDAALDAGDPAPVTDLLARAAADTGAEHAS